MMETSFNTSVGNFFSYVIASPDRRSGRGNLMKIFNGIASLSLAMTFCASCIWADEVVIKAKRVEKISLDPKDAQWDQVSFVQIPLSKQNLVSPHGGGSASSLEVKTLYNSKEIAFMLRWKDKVKDAKWDLTNRFSDACAIEFPLKGGNLPSPFMGEKGNPVNIWRWLAIAQEKERYPAAYADFHRVDAIETMVKFLEKPAENLTAQGFGTIARSSNQDVEGFGEWEKGEWRVILKRSLKSKAGTSFKENSFVPIAFALWDGGTGERDGMKSVSFWHWLVLGEAKVSRGATEVERGKTVFARYGCAACHGPQGKGGVKNPNSQGGEVPPIERVAEGFTEEEVKKVIREGRVPQKAEDNAPYPPLWMNAWQQVMEENELDDLTKYLFSLMPKGKKEEW